MDAVQQETSGAVACIAGLRAEMTNQWNAAQYDAKHAFVYEKAKGLVDLLAPKAGERILDLGCGTGVLTAEIAGRGADILGVDRSEEMISQARRKFPALKFEVLDARQLRFSAELMPCFPMPCCTGFQRRSK